MGARSQAGGHPNSSDEPPVPGGDPDQPPPDLPSPPREHNRTPKGRDQGEYGHMGIDDRPESKDKPKPHQIY